MMGVRKVASLAVCLVAALCASAEAVEQITVAEESYLGRPAVVMDNGVVRVVILPWEGGRVIEYALKKTGRNHFFADRKQLQADGSARYAGGLADLIGERGCYMWPGDFFDVHYEFRVDQQPDRASVTVSAQKGIVSIERSMTVYAGDRRLDVRATYTNVGQDTAELIVRMNTVWNVGGGNAADDYAFFPAAGYLARARGAWSPEMPFSEYYQALKGWWWVADTATRELLVCMYRPDEVRSLLRWGGEDSYTFELVGRKSRVPPGGIVSVQCTYYLLAGPDDLPSMQTGLLTAREDREELTGTLSAFFRDPDQLMHQSRSRADLIRGLGEALDRGEHPAKHEKGLLLRVYNSELDDSYQPYALYVPSRYEPDRPHPLILVLHGADATETSELLATDLMAYAERRGYILASPYTRGQMGAWGLGELEVLRVLQIVREQYNIDDDRVFVTGVSMGGFGAWHMGMSYPHLFAGIAPIVGTATEERAENLRHVPVYMIAGTLDRSVKIDGAREMYRVLRDLSYDVTLRELPQYGHGAFVADLGDLFDWMDRRRLVSAPVTVTYTTDSPDHERAYWIGIGQFVDYQKPASVRARVFPDNQLTIQAQNVGQLTLTPGNGLVNPSTPLHVSINGQPPLTVQPPASGRGLTLYARFEGAQLAGWATEDPSPDALRKSPALAGPIRRITQSNHILVYGTAGTDQHTAANLAEAKLAADYGPMRFFKPIVKADTDVTEDDIRDRHLVLFGGPQSNTITARIHDRLPISSNGEAVVFGEQRFEGPDVGYRMVYPNPLNPQRLVMVNGGVSAEAVKGIWEIGSNWDYVIFDGKAKQKREDDKPPPFLASGYFDRFWKPTVEKR